MNCPNCSASNPDSASVCTSCGADLFAQAPTMATPPESQSPIRLSDWQRQSRESTILPPGFDIGSRYRVVAFLGRGGMGAVYRVHDNELNRDVALKLIRPELDDPNLMERFKREIALSSLVTHRNVLRVYDLGENDGVKYLTMQLVEGEDLATIMRRERPVPVDRAVRIFRQICEGLAAAHEQGVLHRDLKPANVMVGRDDHVYLTDFGLARTTDQPGLTASGAIVGTPDYMSPEQVKGEKLDARSDIYSLGVLLFQVLTGQLPFQGRSTYEVMIERVQHDAPRPSAINPRIPPNVARVVERCLAMRPDARYQSVNEIIEDLGGAVAPRRMRSRRALLIGAVAAIVLLGLGGMIASLFVRSAAPQQAAEQKPVSVLVADLENRSGDAIFDETLEPILSIGLEGARFVTTYNRAQARRAADQVKPGATSLDESVARLVGMREGVQVVVAGTLQREDDAYRLTTRAIETATGKELGRADEVAKDREAVLKVTGTIAKKLRIILGDAPSEELASETFTAASLESAREYAKGQELQWEGKFEEAIARYAAATKLDPTMGRAYAGMAAMYANLGDREQAEKHYKLAMQHIDRMMDREKYRTRGGYYLLMRNHDKAIEEYRELARQFPADTAAINNLALGLFYKRDMKRAMEEGRRPVEIYPKNVLYRNNLALYAMYAGEFDTAMAEARRVLELNPEFVKAFVALALSQAAIEQFDAAAETYRRLQPVSARGAQFATTGLADLALLRGDHARAIEILRAANPDLRKRTMLAEALLASGQKREAAREAKGAAEGSESETILYPAARVLIAAGEFDEATTIAAKLRSRIESEPQMYAKLIVGEVLLAQQRPRDAIAIFTEAHRLSDSWMGRYLR
ncbi:MAG TPA: protein kinase, partial [Thermoanaerobaculia bacterium]